MRKITKIRRSVRAISPVISVLLMIAIAVAASLVAYAWVSGYMDFTTTKVGKSIQIQSVSETAVYVQNVGESDVTLKSLYVNGVLAPDAAFDSAELSPSETSRVTTVSMSWADESRVTLKVVTEDGTSAEYTKTFSGVTGTSYGEVTSLSVSPDPASGSSGIPVSFMASASDGVHFWDVSTSATWAIDAGAGGTWTNNVYTPENPGTWTVTASYSGQIDTVQLTITGGVIGITVAPATSTIISGATQTFSATATDGVNSWDVTSSTTWDISAGAGGSWTGNVYTSSVAGTWTVTGTYSSHTDTASLTVQAGTPTSISISPASETIFAGESVTYIATATDGVNSWDVSTSATWAIDAGAGGTWTNNVYTSATAGDWTVTGTYSGLTDTADLIVEVGTVTGITVTPDPSTIAYGETQTFSATATDGVNSWDVTSSTTWDISAGAGGTWTDNVYTASAAGTWTVTATHAGVSGTADLTVTPGTAVSIEVTPATATITAGESVTYTATAFDGVNSWTVTATWEISASAGGSWAGSVYTSANAGTWTVTATYSSLTDTASLTINPAISMGTLFPEGIDYDSGNYQSGSLDDMQSSNDAYYTARSSGGGTQRIDYNCEFDIDDLSISRSDVTRIDVTLEGHYSNSKTQTVYIWNSALSWGWGDWEQVDQTSIGSSDQTITFSKTSDFNNYIDSNGNIFIRIRTSGSYSSYNYYNDYFKIDVTYNP